MGSGKEVLFTLLAGATAAALFGGGAMAEDDTVPCGQFDLDPRYVGVGHVDHGKEGVSLGDSRVGHIALMNADDEDVAQFYFHSVVILGGTGCLAGTSGTVVLTRDQDMNRFCRFDLSCPGE